MKLSDFDYYLPPELIAQKPAVPRDSSRLMFLDKENQTISHYKFTDIVNLLKPDDVLVFNNSKVFPARLIGKKQDTGGQLEVFLLKSIAENKYEVLIGGRRKKIGQEIIFSADLSCQLLKQLDDQVWEVEFNKSGRELDKLVDEVGEVPTPPYIKSLKGKGKSEKLKEDYQTVYAKHRGSAAAPTAGFHFTEEILNRFKAKGIKIEFITLHVGLGTFAPVKVDDISKHKIHSEFAIIEPEVASRLNKYKKEGRRIITVGTTSTRTLEAFTENGLIKKRKKWVDIYIYPGYEYKFVDGMITNFHLPKSSLIMMISAFAGHQFIKHAYQEAIKEKYRFYSFGDGMLIL